MVELTPEEKRVKDAQKELEEATAELEKEAEETQP